MKYIQFVEKLEIIYDNLLIQFSNDKATELFLIELKDCNNCGIDRISIKSVNNLIVAENDFCSSITDLRINLFDLLNKEFIID